MLIQVGAQLRRRSVSMVGMFLLRLMFSRASWRSVLDDIGRLLGRGIHGKIVNWHVD